ncbi:hypothetical protein BJX99DRAFT_267482 [Aspergillus californicus]
MSFASPPGPPPPSVPEGWTTQFDDTYKQWFFINLATGRSQWDHPQSTPIATPPAATPSPALQAPIPPSEQSHSYSQHPFHDQSTSLPPSYEESGPGNPSAVTSAADSDKKNANLFGSNNPYNAEPGTSGSSNPGGFTDTKTIESDAELAARLQAEEDAQSRSAGPGAGAGAASNYYSSNDAHTPHSPTISSTGDRDKGKEKKKGFFSKLMSKASASSASGHGPRPVYTPPRPPHHAQPQVGYGHAQQGPGYGAPGGYYPPQQGYGPGYGPQPGYGYGGYPQQGMYGQPARRQGGGGMGMAGAAALGVGGGLIGGALLADAIDDDHDDYGGGGDYGGGDDFGGDF